MDQEHETQCGVATGTPDSRVDLKKAAIRGSFWVTLGFVGSIVVKLISSVILTRFIHPETYGVMDLVLTVLVAIHLFSDIGLGPCLVQSPRGEEKRFLNTVWTMQLVRNVILVLVAVIVARPVSIAYHRTILRWLIPAVGLFNLLEALYSPGMLLFNRRLKRGPIVAVEFVGSLVTVVATVTTIFFWNPGGFRQVLAGTIANLPFDESLVWTIVIGSTVAKIVSILLTYLLSPGMVPRLDWEKRTVTEVFGFGRWVFLSTVLAFFSIQGDRLLAPGLAGFENSGLYGRAATLVAIATGLIDTISGTITFPTISRICERGGDVAPSAERVGLFSKVIGSVLLTGLLVAGPSVVSVLYPVAYAGVGWLLQCLAIVGWFQCNSSIAGGIFLGLGRPKQLTVANLAKLVGLAVSVIPATQLARSMGWNPLSAVLIALGFAEVCRYAVVVTLGLRLRVWSLWHDGLAAVAVASTSIGALVMGGRLVPWVLSGPPLHRRDWMVSAILHAGIAMLMWSVIAGILWRQGKLRLQLKEAGRPAR